MARNRTTISKRKRSKRTHTINGYLLNRNGAIIIPQVAVYRTSNFIGRYKPTRHTLHII